MNTSLRRHLPLCAELLVLLLLALSALGLGAATPGCAASDAASDGADGALPPDSSGAYLQGLAALERHEVRAAADSFAVVLDSPADPDYPEAVVGLVLTELLLTPERSAGAQLITQLGGRPMNVERDVLGTAGLLALLAAHTDELELERRLDDTLPWTAAQLESASTFFDGVPAQVTGNTIGDTAAELAAELMRLADRLEGAAEHPAFEVFALRGAAFHARTNLRLTRPELLLMAAGLRLSASALLWVSAYDWPLDLRATFGSATDLDAQIERLNAVAFRALRPEAAERLDASREQLRAALLHLRQVVAEGGANPTPGNLRWSALSGQEIDALTRIVDTLLEADSALAPVQVPFADPPETTLDLRPLFAGRTLPPERALILHTVDDFGDGSWEIDAEAVRALWLDGVLAPSCTPALYEDGFDTIGPDGAEADDEARGDDCPTLFDDPALGDKTLEQITDPFVSSVEADFNLQ